MIDEVREAVLNVTIPDDLKPILVSDLSMKPESPD